MFQNKKAISGVVWVVIFILVILFTSTQKVSINDTQIKTASQVSCKLINQDFDEANKVCIPKGTQQNVTPTYP